MEKFMSLNDEQLQQYIDSLSDSERELFNRFWKKANQLSDCNISNSSQRKLDTLRLE
jgi:tRNA isopentenyl-2-thiomethyl-A-37 hydroxylase MiaE